MKYSVLEELCRSLKENKSLVCASTVEVSGHSPAAPDGKMLVFADGTTKGTIGGGMLEYKVTEKALELFSAGKNCLLSFDLESGKESSADINTRMPCGGFVKVFFEYFTPADQLLIFGGGHVGSSLVYHALHSDFAVTCIDSRPEIREKISFEYAVTAVNSVDSVPAADRTFIVIASHSHESDFEYLKTVLESGIKYNYIGVVASVKKWQTMKEKLTANRKIKPDYSLIFSPAGLSSGGSSPDEIALSILAEINTVKYQSSGLGHLRDVKKGKK